MTVSAQRGLRSVEEVGAFRAGVRGRTRRAWASIVAQHVRTGREESSPSTEAAIEVMSHLCREQDGETAEVRLAERGCRHTALAFLTPSTQIRNCAT